VREKVRERENERERERKRGREGGKKREREREREKDGNKSLEILLMYFQDEHLSVLLTKNKDNISPIKFK
jgi:hypothetical protein